MYSHAVAPHLSGASALPAMADCVEGIGELKRIRRAGASGSVATRLFRAAWGALCADAEPTELADDVLAEALVATRLGALDAAVMRDLGLSDSDCAAIWRRAFAEAVRPLAGQVDSLRLRADGPRMLPAAPVPAFVDALSDQPRAGATAPGKPRIVLEPPESHAEHCLVVAVAGVLIAEHEGADRGRVFVAGLAHHLHNARMPDSGFAGEILLGDSLAPLMRRLFATEIAALAPPVAAIVRDSLDSTIDATTREGRAFHTADVFDRVLQMRHYEQVAGFRARHALDDLDLVHAGPLQDFQKAALREAGLL